MKQKKYSKYMYQSMSIKNKMFFSNIILIVVSLGSLAIFANNVSTKAIVNKAINNVSRELELIDKNLQTLTNSVEDYSRILATDERLQNELLRKMSSSTDRTGLSDITDNLEIRNTLSKVISNIVQPNTHIATASVLDYKNVFFDIGYADNLSLSKTIDSTFVRKIKEMQVPIWTDTFSLTYNYGAKENVFAIAKAVIHKETGQTEGAVILYLKESDIASIYLDSMEYKGGKFYILNNNGEVISSQNKDELSKKFSEISKVSIENQMRGNGSSISGSGQDKVLVTSHTFDKLQWKIISVIPLDELTIENKKINHLILFIGLACLIFAFIVSFMFSRTITRPILSMARTMKQIRQGNLNVRTTYNSLDEIGLLGEGFNGLMDRIERLMVEIYEEQKMKADIEFKLLQSQVKPHFLYNTMETIISFVKLDMKEEAITTTKYLANFYRISLSKGNDIIKIKDEVQLTESYLEIQKLRYFEYMDFTMTIEAGIMQYSIPKLTLQPIVENAIYHGLKQKKEKGQIHITGCRREGCIAIEVYDDGVGMHADDIEKVLNPSGMTRYTDFGVSSVNNRVKILYGDKYGLHIESEVGVFTKVTILLPLMEE